MSLVQNTPTDIVSMFTHRFFDFNRSFLVPFDLKENDDEYIIELDLPGFDKNEISISVENNVLLVSAERETQEEEDNPYQVLHRERLAQKYERKIKFRRPIDTTKASVEYNDGVLVIKLPKTEASKPTKLTL
ncbi:MAG: Hsp20/alpha crystallin family protein [Candidatus Heimdallarchaeota archaeon]|nr:Hsp20/alpha crystallin family protein [Candidatus Heimdallarchaeota archaeon]